MALQVQAAYAALYTRLMHEVGGVQFYVVEFEGVDFNLLFQQRPELYVYHKLFHVGDGVFHLRQGVVLLYHLEAFDAEVERKHQFHALH